MTAAIYKFGKGIKDYDCSTVGATNLLGGKGAKLAEMGALGLPVPPGVTITTEQCNKYFAVGAAAQAGIILDLVDEVLVEFKDIKKACGYMPLVSVRSGSRKSMPGMMDTVLNVGINKANLTTWGKRIGEDAARDCYVRFTVMYGEVVMGIPAEAFADCDKLADYEKVYTELTGHSTPPQTLEAQLHGCIEAVFKSWFSERAVAYRKMHGYSDDWGTAVNIQQMVFGNRNNKSASGVLFTRDFNTGENKLIIDWLPNAQGEDVVAGTHTPMTREELGEWNPSTYHSLRQIAIKLEEHYMDMQDIEFTVDDGELFILQTRDGKRSALAAFKIAYDLHKDGLIDRTEALSRVSGKQYAALSKAIIDPSYTKAPDVTGIPAAGNLVTGVAVLSADTAITCTKDCILVTDQTTPKDFAGMAASIGILTRKGGITSHAAVVARGMDKACVVGAENLKFEGLLGKQITMDGATGRIWVGKKVPVLRNTRPDFVEEMVGWATEAYNTKFLTVTPEKLSNGQVAYVDVSGHLNTHKGLSGALKAVRGSKGSGVIGFGGTDTQNPDDSEFLGFFGVDPQTHAVGVYALIEKILRMKMWTKTFKKSWALHFPASVPAAYVKNLRILGWSVVTNVTNFKTALSIDGYVVMSDEFRDQLHRENMTFSDIASLVVDAGRKVIELPARMTKNRLMFDVLGG